MDSRIVNLIPTEDWELNVLLLKVAADLNATEFERLKFLCTGGVPKGVLEKLTTPEMFFRHLKERRMISKDNLLLLQAFMSLLGREDLRKLAADYAKKIGETLYFHTAELEPAEGFKHIQFHVEGNLDSFQRSDLEALRAMMARLLFVPQHFIVLKGVEPGGSLNLTFMIQEKEATTLKELFFEHKDSFARLQVDGISIDNSEIIDPVLNMKRRCSVPTTAVTQEQIRILYERNLHLESQVEESQVRSLESQADAILARQEAQQWREKENYFRSLLARVLEKEKEDEVKMKSRKRRGSVQICLLHVKEKPQNTTNKSSDLLRTFGKYDEDRVKVLGKSIMRRGSVDFF